jgi:Tol biopolymer transport system component
MLMSSVPFAKARDDDSARRIVTAADVLETSRTISIDESLRDMYWIGASDRVVFAALDVDSGARHVKVLDTRHGRAEAIARGAGPRPSPDGKRVAFAAPANDGTVQLWVAKLDGDSPQRLTYFDQGLFGYGVDYYTYEWSHDGRHILLVNPVGWQQSERQGSDPLHPFTRAMTEKGVTVMRYGAESADYKFFQRSEVWLVDAISGTANLLVTEDCDRVMDLAWFPGDRTVAYRCAANDVTPIISLEVSTGRRTELLRDVRGIGLGMSVSPDGRYIAINGIQGFNYKYTC